MVYGTYNYSYWGLLTYNWGASHCTKSYETWVTVWWLSPTPLKNDGVKVSWDDEIPNVWKNDEKWKMFQTTNQVIYI